MSHHTEHHHPSLLGDCPRTRLSQGSLAAVDVCNCGMLQVHVGALTLRLAPCALSELTETLQQALLAHAERSGARSLLSRLEPERGEA